MSDHVDIIQYQLSKLLWGHKV